MPARPASPSAGADDERPVLERLPNGVRLLAVPMPHVRSASVGVFLRVGSRDESPASNGIGHVLEHMAFKGTRTRSVQAINLDAERLGAEVNAFTGKDTTGYFMTGLGSHVPRMLEMTADIVLNSTFPEAELSRELDVIRQEAVEYDEDPADSAGDLLDRAIWGEHPMGMPVIGTVENIERFSRDDLLAHVRSYYLPGNTVVAAAGQIDVPAFFEQARHLFEGMAGDGAGGGAPAAPLPYAAAALGRRFSQVSQVFLQLAYPLAPQDLQELPQPQWRTAASVAAILFGGGMSAPLTDTVRERLGLAYTAEASSDSGDAWFNFIVHAVTTPDKLDPLIEATGRLLREQAEHIEPVHLERARNQLIVSRVRSAERSYATLERSVEELFASGTVSTTGERIAHVEAVTADEVRAVFARMARLQPALAITGKGATDRLARRLAGSLRP